MFNYTHVIEINMLPNVCHYITELEVVQEKKNEMVLVYMEVVEEGEE